MYVVFSHAFTLLKVISVDFEVRVATDSPKLHSQVGGYHSSLIAFAVKVDGRINSERATSAHITDKRR